MSRMITKLDRLSELWRKANDENGRLADWEAFEGRMSIDWPDIERALRAAEKHAGLCPGFQKALAPLLEKIAQLRKPTPPPNEDFKGGKLPPKERRSGC